MGYGSFGNVPEGFEAFSNVLRHSEGLLLSLCCSENFQKVLRLSLKVWEVLRRCH